VRRVLRKRPLLGMAIVSTVATIIGIAISLVIDWFPEQASTASDDIDLLYDVLLIASVPIFVLVMSVALYSVFAFRAKPGDLSDGAPIHGNTRLEVVWVTIPFIMVSALAIYGWVVLDDIEAKKPNTLVVNVTAQQFAWSFDYPAEKVKSNRLVLPKDRPVEFRIKSKDVLHDFWVPEFRLKSDAVPGITTKIRLTPSRLGEYDVVCAELCGIGHSTMRQDVRVLTRGDYEAWVSKEQQSAADGGAAAAGGDEAAAGKGLFNDTGCNACHTLADAGSNATIGPDLNELAADAAKYGKPEGQSPEEYVKAAIEDPGAFTVPGFDKGLMPATYKDDLSPEEIDSLVKYLLDVGGGDGK
jgi:cytochrome c oxidase subunit II